MQQDNNGMLRAISPWPLSSRPDRPGLPEEVTGAALPLLAPFVRWGLAAANRRTRFLPIPLDAPSGHAPGPDPLRILLVGSGPAVGWGVTTHAVALPGALARDIASRTGRGCTVDTFADPHLSSATAHRALESAKLCRYDAVVLTLGINDALRLTPVTRWQENLRNLLQILERDTGPRVPVVATGIHPLTSVPPFGTLLGSIAESHATRLNAVTRELCDLTPGAFYAPLPAATACVDGDRHRAASQYTQWAKVIGNDLAPQLPSEHPDGRYARSAEGEASRQHTVTALALDRLQDREELQRLTQLAQEALGTQTALITVLDDDRQWHLASAGKELAEVPREFAMCNITIDTDDGLTIRDTRQDERVRDNPLVTAGPQIRFYAGVPIEAPNGERIGALCVIDPQPRRRHHDNVDISFLRQLVHLIEQELWSTSHQPPFDTGPTPS